MNRNIKLAIKYLLYYSPKCLHDKLKEIQGDKELKAGLERARRTKVSREDFARLIDSLDLDSDVFLHTSMINVGKIQGGAKFIVEKVLEKVDTSKHTLLVSALPYRGSFKDYLETNPVFDVRSAPIEMGAVNELLAKREDALRSVHPTHSVVGIGKNAKEYIDEHQRDKTPFGEHSPYCKLFKNGGKILLLGATLNNVTCIHALEDMLGDVHPVNPYLRELYQVSCIDSSGKQILVETTCHSPLKGIIRDLQFSHDAMIKTGVMTTIRLGEADLMVIDAKKFALFYFDLLLSGRSIYGKHKVKKELSDKIDEIKIYF